MNICEPVWAAEFGKFFKVLKKCNHPGLYCDILDHLFVARHFHRAFVSHNETFKYCLLFLRNLIFAGNGLNYSRF